MTTPDDTQLLDLIPPEAEIVRRIIEEVRQYPRIRRPLLRFLAADDFDELIDAVKENSDNIKLILDRMGVMENRMGVMEERLASVEEATQRIPVIEERLTSVEESVARIPVIEERLTSVEESVARIPAMEEDIRYVRGQVDSLRGDFGRFRGESYERQCAEEIIPILDGYIAVAVLADREKIKDAFVRARQDGLISREELLDSYQPDIIARAAHDDSETENFAVVEASITFNRQDLENSARRARLIAKVTNVPSDPYLVTHHDWPGDMDDAALELGVTIIRHEVPEYATET